MQLVYFNDLHKNLGCNKGRTAKISIIPVTFTVLPVKFCALQLPPVPIFFCSLSPSADKCPAATDISIVQKTCVFRPVDISVPAAKRNELIYQSVYSLLGVPLPSAHCVRSHLPQGDGFWRWRESLRFDRKAPACLQRAGTLRWARGREGCSESPLPTSGLHPPRNGPRATRP